MVTEIVSGQVDVIIVGGGPAGLAAGLYAARMSLSAVLVERGPVGGQLLNTELIEDYPGFESILGSELAIKMGDHARKFGLSLREFESVLEIDVEADGTKVVRLDDGQVLTAPALIMAAGGLPRRLDVPGEAALEEGDFLTRYASKVYIIHRRDQFRAQPVLQERARANPKIEFILKAQVREIQGHDTVSNVRYLQNGVEKDLPVGGVFIFVGFLPNSNLLKAHAEHDAAGYFITDHNMQTSIEGLWAVGDVRAQLTKQIATAVGDGTTAAVAASQYVEKLRDRQRRVGVEARA